jgi:hypothetical protein
MKNKKLSLSAKEAMITGLILIRVKSELSQGLEAVRKSLEDPSYSDHEKLCEVSAIFVRCADALEEFLNPYLKQATDIVIESTGFDHETFMKIVVANRECEE